MSLHIGTSGWNYPTGRGTWNGLFYPATRSRRAGTAGFDELRFYAEHFGTVEVNSSFYGTPRAEVTRAWASRTPPGFEFSVKLYQKFTHPKMFRAAALGTVRGTVLDPALDTALGSHEALGNEAPGATALLDMLAEVTQSDIDDVRAGIEPLVAAGKLGALLAQFPPSFSDSPRSRDYLARLLGAFSDYPMAVELRHKSWSDTLGDTLALLNASGAALVQIDEPKFRLSIEQNYLPNVTSFYYMRLHGRNAAQWWQHENSEDRYNYLYSGDELREFSDVAGAARRLVKRSYLYTNNHFASKSVVNAVMLQAQLGEPIEGEYPAELRERYPELEQVLVSRAAARPQPTPPEPAWSLSAPPQPAEPQPATSRPPARRRSPVE
jgi:uncharacterized protein YecE (DUF72 family)